MSVSVCVFVVGHENKFKFKGFVIILIFLLYRTFFHLKIHCWFVVKKQRLT